MKNAHNKEVYQSSHYQKHLEYAVFRAHFRAFKLGRKKINKDSIKPLWNRIKQPLWDRIKENGDYLCDRKYLEQMTHTTYQKLSKPSDSTTSGNSNGKARDNRAQTHSYLPRAVQNRDRRAATAPIVRSIA